MVWIRHLTLCLAAVLAGAEAPAGTSPWIRPSAESDPLVWGHRKGIVFGLPSRGGMPGPRGLVRVGIYREGEETPDLINFIAFEPVVAGRKGLSELEWSRLDGVRGKRLSVTDSRDGVIAGNAASGEELRVTLDCEPFENGAHVRAELRVLADLPQELHLRLFAAEGSAPIEEATVTATMGNYGRLRRVTLEDRWLDSRKLFEGYTGNAFVEKQSYPVERLPRLPAGDVLVAAVSDEDDPASVRIASPRWWQYRSIPLTQTWRVPADDIQPDLRLRLNGRRVYWQTRREIPGGISFENFELRSRFVSGQTFIFGLWRQSPRELGVDPGAPPTEAGATRWHHPLYLDGGGMWRRRLPVEITSSLERAIAGFPAPVQVGTAEGQADLVGALAESLRVTSESGVELLFELRDRHGVPLRRGPIPSGATLTLPAVTQPSGATRAYVYFDNPAAGSVPDFLEDRTSILNGGMEGGDGDAPPGWRHDPPDDEHRALWVPEEPRSGERCLKTVVSQGAEPTWIATRQRGIRILGGARYELRAWVRARDVEGFAGWYAHVGNDESPMLRSPMLSGGSGTYDWKEVRATIDTPPEATTLSLGTVLRGSGTAWFDDASLECASTPLLRLHAGPVEELRLNVIERTPPSGTSGTAGAGTVSRTLRALHFGAKPLERALVSADASEVLGKARRFGRRLSARIAGDGAHPGLLGDRLLLEARLPPRSEVLIPLRFEEGVARTIDSPESYRPLLASPANLAQDPGFELEADHSTWTVSGGGDGIEVERVEGGLFGRRCGRIHVGDSSRPTWSGWRQDVQVEPGGTYLYAAWVRSENIRDGNALLHAHFLARAGSLSRIRGFASAGPSLSGTQPWTLLSGVLTLPEDAATFQVHLTMLARGTLWHDGVVVARLVPGVIGPAVSAPAPTGEEESGIEAWPVPAVVKVFDDDRPPAEVPPARISLARGEAETLQVAVRSRGAGRRVRIEVTSPRSGTEKSLEDIEVHVVGTVPIDHPSSYYRSERPAWERRIPRGQGGCDGWPGSWPDPLLPARTLDLEPGKTRSVWITVRAPARTPAGTYKGNVRLVVGETMLRELPFTVEVWDFTLPEERHVGAIYDLRLHGDAWSLPGKSDEDVRIGFWRLLSERRLCPDRIQPEPVIRYRNGQVFTDFSEYDRAAERYFGEFHFPFTYTPRVFYLFGWGHPSASKFGEAPYEGSHPYEDADRSKLRPEYRKAYQACLRAYWEHMKEQGWSDRCVLYISDEPFDREAGIRSQMQALCAMIHEVDPEIPIYSSTWHHQPEWDGALGVWGLGHYGVVSPETLRAIRSGGARVWFTTDGQMCTDTPLCAIERLLPRYCFHFGAEAYEFWGCTWLTYDPYEFGWHRFIHQSSAPGKSTWVRYPNGDGYLAYPGRAIGHDGPVSSIRLDAARDGAEDFEYLHLLHELVTDAKEHGLEVSEEEQALADSRALVPIPNAGGRYSTRILTDVPALERSRERIARGIVRIAGLLEAETRTGLRLPRPDPDLQEAAVDNILCGPGPLKSPVHHLWLTDRAREIEESCDSPVIESPHPFNEALISFNADVPPGSLLVAQLRVGRTSHDSWSPYLDMFEWGDGSRDRKRTLEWEDGRIDVDYFRSGERYDRAQYRLIVLRSPDAEADGSARPDPVCVKRVALCFSDTTGLPHSVPGPEASAPAAPPEKWQRRLPVPARSQKVEPGEIAGRICSPTSVAMVLEYRGVRRPTQEVARRVYDPIHEIYGNWPRNVQAAYTLGVPGYLTRFREWREVEAAIARGQPLIASIRAEKGQLRGAPYPATDGHLLVIVGFDADGRVLVNDPAASSPEGVPRAYSRSEMEEVWLRHGGTAYVLLPAEP